MVYNPTASVNTERFNGLIKTELKSIDQVSTLQEILDWARFNLNHRERLGSEAPRAMLNMVSHLIALDMPKIDKTPKFPHKVTIKDHKGKLSLQQIVADGEGNTGPQVEGDNYSYTRLRRSPPGINTGAWHFFLLSLL